MVYLCVLCSATFPVRELVTLASVPASQQRVPMLPSTTGGQFAVNWDNTFMCESSGVQSCNMHDFKKQGVRKKFVFSVVAAPPSFHRLATREEWKGIKDFLQDIVGETGSEHMFFGPAT